MSRARRARRANPASAMPLWPFVLGGTLVVGVVGVLIYRRLGETNRTTQQAIDTAAPLTGLATTANQVLGATGIS